MLMLDCEYNRLRRMLMQECITLFQNTVKIQRV